MKFYSLGKIVEFITYICVYVFVYVLVKGENPAGGARGGGGVRGESRFFSQEARRDDHNQLLQPAFNLAASTICSV